MNLLRFLWIALPLSATVFLVFLYAVRKDEESVGSNQCIACLSGLVSLIHHYHEKYGHFPPAYMPDKQGKPMHSWRILMLETTHPTLLKQYNFDEPWNGPNNRKLADKMPGYFRCPNARSPRTNTSYVLLVGPDTAFPGSKATTRKDRKRKASETILLVEAENLNVHWMEPRDWDVQALGFAVSDPDRPSLSSHDPQGPAVCFVDGSVMRLPRTFSKEQLEEMSRIRQKGNGEE